MSDFNLIQHQIRKFVKKYYLNELFKGLILFLLFGFLLLLITALIEYFLWLPPATRRFLFYAQWLVLALFFVIFLGRSLLNIVGLRNDLSDEIAAQIIGKFFPDINDKLLNTIQLYHSNDASELLLAGISQKTQQLKSYKFSKAIDFKHNFKYLPLLFIPLFLVLFLRLLHYDLAIKQSYQRVLSYQENFAPPLPYSFEILDSLKVISGQDYKLRVGVSGEVLPQNLYLKIDNKQLLFEKKNDSLFQFHFPVVYDDLQFSLSDGKYNLGYFSLDVLVPPVLKQVQIKVIYPKYLHKKPVIYNRLTNLTVPQSSKIIWQLHTSDTDSIHFGFNQHFTSFPLQNNEFILDTIAQHDFSYQVQIVNNKVYNTDLLNFDVHVIKDKFPTLKVVEKKDSLKRQNYYRITAADDYGITRLRLVYTNESDHSIKKLNIPVESSELAQTIFVFPGSLTLQQGTTYTYYFEVFDNDAFHGYKSVTSRSFYYNMFTKKQIAVKNLEQQAQNIDEFKRLKEKMFAQNLTLNKLSDKLMSQKNQDWQSRKMFQNAIQQSEQQEQFFKQSIQKFKDLLQQIPEKQPDKTKKDLEKRLEELAQMKKKEKLLDELKKLADKLNKEDLIKKLKDLENYSEHQEKSLERILELTKKYYLQQKIQKMSETLNELSKKQDSLARTSQDRKQQQDSLNAQLNAMQKQSDSLQKMNQSLKRPLAIPDSKTDMDEIKQEMQKASKLLQENQSKQANQSQSKAAQKMKKLANKMQMSMLGGGASQNEEDVKTLQAILKSLLHFSFKEEQMLTDLYTDKSHKHLTQQLLGQNHLKVYFKHINDSLYTLALRNPKISQMILDEAFEIEQNLEKSLSYLSENQLYQTQNATQYILKSSNTLANFLSNALDQMKNASPSMGQGQGQKGKGFSLPDIIKKQAEALSNAQAGLKKKQGKGEKAKKNGKQKNQGDEGAAKRQYELYKMQQQVKENLNQLSDKFSDQATKQKIKQLNKEMTDLQKRILKEGITQSVVNKMIALQHELLKLKNATFNQHEDNKRQSRTNLLQYQGIDSLFLRENFKFLPQNELLKRLQIPVNEQVKEKIQQYLN